MDDGTDHFQMCQFLSKGFARYDEGALVVDVQEETDNKEVPPCMILKSDGAALYDTTDLGDTRGEGEGLSAG